MVLQQRLDSSGIRVTIIASEQRQRGAETVSIPPQMMRLFTQMQLDELDLMRSCAGTYTLGTQYRDCSQLRRDYWEPHGICGASIDDSDMFLMWHNERAHGRLLRPYQSYSLAWAASVARKSPVRIDEISPIQKSEIYGIHLHRETFLSWLHKNALANGVECKSDEVIGFSSNGKGGIAQVKTKENGNFPAELFIDGTGTDALLLGQFLSTDFMSWEDYLPCNRILAGVASVNKDFPPFASVSGLTVGTLASITLANETHFVLSYCNDYCDDSSAKSELRKILSNSTMDALTASDYVAGSHSVFWSGNVIGVGESAARIDAVGSTSLTMVHHGLEMLTRCLPDRNKDTLVREHYNREMNSIALRMRDRAQLRFHVSKRTDSTFWNEARSKPLSDTMSHSLALYKECGLFDAVPTPDVSSSYFYYMLSGNGCLPRRPNGYSFRYSADDANKVMRLIEEGNESVVAGLPVHADFLQQVRII